MKGKTLATLLVLAVGLVTAAIVPAEARASTNAWLNCTFGGGFKVELPAGGGPRMSVFAVSIDGGQWQWSSYYYTEGELHYIHRNGRWEFIPHGANFGVESFGDSATHVVVGWEYRWTYGYNANNQLVVVDERWIKLNAYAGSPFNPLTTCEATSTSVAYTGGLVFTGP